ncbi:hypothetical protein [Mycobacterium phage Kashi_VT1]|nr:hypothetical protein [Mycobacterium phage Kashi_VT1]
MRNDCPVHGQPGGPTLAQEGETAYRRWQQLQAEADKARADYERLVRVASHAHDFGLDPATLRRDGR